MTYDDFTAILTAVRADVHNRLDQGGEKRSLVRLFDMSAEDADKAAAVLQEGFWLTSLLMGPDLVALQYFSIGVDVGKKLAEAEQMQSMLPPEDSA